MPWNKVTLLGVGLLGGSLGRGLLEGSLAHTVMGFVRRAETIDEALSVGAISEGTRSLEKAVSGADLVVLCTPLQVMERLLREALPYLPANALVTDVGSVKQPVVALAERLLDGHGAQFVGSHPMAGSEKTGVLASRADLFRKRMCVLTPTDKTSEENVRRIEALWSGLGASVLHLDPDHHDALVARGSHLPHLIASLLAHQVLDPEGDPLQPQLCATGFRDTTRIAAGDGRMWRDILEQNRGEVLKALGGFRERLADLESILKAEPSDDLLAWLETARDRRMGWRLPAEDSEGEGTVEAEG